MWTLAGGPYNTGAPPPLRAAQQAPCNTGLLVLQGLGNGPPCALVQDWASASLASACNEHGRSARGRCSGQRARSGGSNATGQHGGSKQTRRRRQHSKRRHHCSAVRRGAQQRRRGAAPSRSAHCCLPARDAALLLLFLCCIPRQCHSPALEAHALLCRDMCPSQRAPCRYRRPPRRRRWRYSCRWAAAPEPRA